MFGFSDFNFWNFIFDFLLRWSFNMGTTMYHSTTAAADSVIPLDTVFGSLLLIFVFNDHSIHWYYYFCRGLGDLWTLRKFWKIIWHWKFFDFLTSTFEISFFIFFFDDHSIWVLLWIIQLLLLLTQWSLWTLIIFLNIGFFLTSTFLNIGLQLDFIGLQFLEVYSWFSSSMIIQYYGSFNTFIILLLLTRWSLWTLKNLYGVAQVSK